MRPYPADGDGLDALDEIFGLIDEFSTEFVTDPPCQPALAGVACRQYDGEFRRKNVEIFGDHLHAAGRHVRDGTVARQRTGPELDFREAFAQAAFALTSIR
jgi:hypothetical protein